ncbi:MAG TPA: insulinase family protein [Lachnospiraceae bacterium]|nr:insulinase family protein [Lachnospiraceae bacterium]
MKIEELSTYEVVERKRIGDLNSESCVLRHKKTGARVAILANDDENKVFSIGFRTPPVNSTGVAHIIEHTVLCGSKQFPVKDPFIELAKGSLNTFLNAMTFPDKTLYPVASCNDKDFQNLMHVYLDAVFYPNIYKEEKIFKQEGWHYEMENHDAPLKLNGVVYNEMKGAFSSPDDVLSREMMNSLYPDTTYGNESGGDPEVIPQLSYQEFLDFHRKYYHPSNSYIYLYGNMDMAEKLDFIDREYLSAFDSKEVDSEIQKQEAFQTVNRVVKEYPIGNDEKEEVNAYFSYNMSIEDTLDRELYIAFQIIDYALCSAPGAPLKQVLTDKGIGTEIYSTYENGIRQPFFSIVAKNANANQEEDFIHTIEEVLQDITRKRFDKKALLAGINYYEFKYREADFGSYPKGLMYGLQVMDSWLYDDKKVFIHVEANETYALLRKKVEENYFEELVEKYLLRNPHKSILILLPQKGLTEKKDRELAEKLQAYKDSLSKEELEQIIQETKALEEYQDSEDSEENLKKIPLLSVTDLKKEANGFVNDLQKIEDTDFLFHNLFTNGICYLRLIFPVDKIPGDLFPYIGIFKGLLGLLNTENFGYADLYNEINIETGGIACVNNVYGSYIDEDKCKVTLELKAKVLENNLQKSIELMQEIMMTSDFTDKKRIKEILAEGKSRMQGQMTSAAHGIALNRALSYVSKTAALNELLSGVDFYRLVESIDANFDKEADQLIIKLQELAKMIFRPENLMVDLVGDSQMAEKLPDLIRVLKKQLYTCQVKEGSFVPVMKKQNEGYKTAGQVQYVCRAGNFKHKGISYTGALKVLKVMMGYDYLWNQVRVKGGAYGCMCSFGKSGDSFFVSYRDPNLTNTVDVYENAAAYIASFEADERTMTQFIIGAVSDLDLPMNPAAKGIYSLSGFLSDLTDADLQKERDEILSCTAKDLQKTAAQVKAFMEENCLCVVGNAQKIEEASGLFDRIENLVK